jgi:DNA sulfur modification protein DndB
MTSNNLIDRMRKQGIEAGFFMQVPALCGNLGGVDYFVITLPYSVMTRYLTTTDRNLSPKERENRKITPSRHRVIANYIIKNPDTYRFSSITCTYGKDGERAPLKWEPIDPTGDLSHLGILTLDQRDPLIIVDGQHRFEGIKQALDSPDQDPTLANDMISIVLFPYDNLRAAQQLFSDLNRNAKKTTKSLDILFDRRDVVNTVVQELVKKVVVFQDWVNLEDAGIPAHSKEMFTLTGIYQTTEPIINAIFKAKLLPEELAQKDSEGNTIDNKDQYVDFLTKVWHFIAVQFPEWDKVASEELDIRDVRPKYLHWNSGVISAIGEFVAASMREKGQDWQTPVETALSHSENNAWRRDEAHWQGLITAGTQVLPRSLVRPQLRAYLKNLAALPLTDGDNRNLGAIKERKEQLRAAIS